MRETEFESTLLPLHCMRPKQNSQRCSPRSPIVIRRWCDRGRKSRHWRANDLMSEDPTSARHAAGAFVTTQWTRVLEARGDSTEAKAALSDLCAAYYGPVLAFIRRDTADEDAARDLTQEFFSRLLARQSLDSVDPQRGRFRSFLLG